MSESIHPVGNGRLSFHPVYTRIREIGARFSTTQGGRSPLDGLGSNMQVDGEMVCLIIADKSNPVWRYPQMRNCTV